MRARATSASSGGSPGAPAHAASAPEPGRWGEGGPALRLGLRQIKGLRERARARSLCAEMHAGFGALRQHCPMNIEASLPAVGARVLAEHEAIVVAAEGGDADELKERIRDHLDATLSVLKEKAFE